MPESKKEAISRKAFVASVGAAVVGGRMMAQPSTADAAESAPKKKEARWGFLINLTKCVGCNTCQVACKTENDVRLGVFQSGVLHHESGTFPNVKRAYVPWMCNHCNKPACTKLCPVDDLKKKFVFPSGRAVSFNAKATYKRPDGIVDVDPERCTGCGTCVTECPYDVRYLDPLEPAGSPEADADAGVAKKCNLCRHRIENGVVPSCVNTCPARARVAGDLNDPDSEISRMLAAADKVYVLLESEETEPRCFYIGQDPAEAYEKGIDTKRRMAIEVQ